ncbi:hypothetical protein ACC702_39270, partial [Rhizobium ruizarguesonis]
MMPSTGPEDAIAMVEFMLTVIRFSRPLPESPDFSYTCSAGMTVQHYRLYIERIDPSKKMARFYALSIEP